MPRLLANRFALEDQAHREGGSAAVFKAVDMADGMAPVAVKLFKPGRQLSERLLNEIFQRELDALDALKQHPNIVRLIDWGLDDGDGNPYVVLEWINEDLVDFMSRVDCAGWDDFAPIAMAILQGIAAMHQLNRAHRDIKPESVLIAPGTIPKVTDFGISKLQSRLSQGVTLSQFGTPPYVPPEIDDGNYTLTRDVFAFAVLVVRCLCGEPLDSHAEVRERLTGGQRVLDVPPKVLELLGAATDPDPAKRPASAEVMLRQLSEIQRDREAAWMPRTDLYLELTNSAIDGICSRLGIDQGEAFDFVLSDTKDAPSFMRAPDPQNTPGHDMDITLIGDSFRYRLRPHAQLAGVLAVIGATKAPPSELEQMRGRGWRGNVVFRRGAPLDVQRASSQLTELQQAVTEHEQWLAERAAEDRQRELFRAWRSLLNAKRDIEKGRGLPLRYRSFDVAGRRVTFNLIDTAAPEVVGQPRLVRVGPGQVVAGEVEDVSDGALTLFVERGDPGVLPKSGQVEYDSMAARFAIDRQSDALEAVRHGRSVRSDLAAKLLDAQAAAPPSQVLVPAYFQRDLDEPKQAAVRAGLGTEDFLVVEGPPGTGKTTFIAELIAQYLRLNPGKRVLLTSQTHIALDNALERIQSVAPQHRLLRIGRSERIAPEVEPLRLENQMEAWRRDVLRTSRQFLRQYAASLGYSMPDTDLSELGGELRAIRQKLREVRGQIQHRLAERREADQEVEALRPLASSVMSLAERIEQQLKQPLADELRAVASEFLNRGIHLAATLEAGGRLGSRLVELEGLIRDARAQEATLADSEEELRRRIATALELASEPLPTVDDLLERISKLDVSNHPVLAKLQEIYVEWEQRFGKSSQFNAALLERAEVVAATCVGLAGVRGALDVTFDLCILDEASKATATEALVPLSRSRHWVLVGDRKQLPPFQEDALNDPALLAKYELSQTELERTLFDHLIESLPSEAQCILSTQYRMVPAIGAMISECFYDGKLTSAPREPLNAIVQAFGASVSWLTTSTNPNRRERPYGTSYTNPCEAQAIQRALERLNYLLDSAGAKARHVRLHVAVLTGYAAQRDHIRRALEGPAASWTRLMLEVSTVDAFQGREADVAMFSITRSNSAGQLGFLTSRRRVNVALSRGRDALVIVGDSDFCRAERADNALREVLSYVEHSLGAKLEDVSQ